MLALLSSPLRGAQKQDPGAKPNIVLILTDDQGWGDIGYNNPENVYTPTLDKLAEEGARLDSHHVMPQCTPTRVACFTGRYPGRFGTNGRQASNAKCFPVGTPTLARMLKSSGYNTYLAGKWHMGSAWENGPNHHGFDSSYGSMAGACGMYDHRYRPGKYEECWHRDHEIIPGYENGTHATDLVAAEATRIIEEKHEKPFFLYLPFHAPHTPLDERGQFVDTPTQRDPDNPKRWLNEDKIKWFNDPEGIIQSEPDPEKRLFLAVVHHLDAAIGQVIKALDKTGQRENTIIIFSSDNGPQVSWGGNAYPDDLHLTDFNQPIPFRGHKCHVWQGGINVPGFINWPGKIKPKKVTDPTHIVDVFPTLANLVGAAPEDCPDFDGTDLAPVLFEDSHLSKRDLYWIWGSNTDRRALREGDWKIVRYNRQPPQKPADWQLFNLKKDPAEKNNVANQHPEIRETLHTLYKRQHQKDSDKPVISKTRVAE